MKHCYLFLVALLFVSTGYGQENILLEEYMPKSIYKIPETKVEKAKYPVIDAHSHDYPSSLEEVAQWVKTMDRKGIEKTVVLILLLICLKTNIFKSFKYNFLFA